MLVAIATGCRAQSLREFRDGLLRVPQESVYYHFWGRLLRPRFDDTEFHNDFAIWSRDALHDEVLAERLAAVDPADFGDLETLRRDVVEIVEERLDHSDGLTARRDRMFHFRRCQTVVFDTEVRIRRPEELAEAIFAMSVGSVYYHVVDARRREPVRTDDFRTWLGQFGPGYAELCNRLSAIDPYFSSLAELRLQVGTAAARFFAEQAQ